MTPYSQLRTLLPRIDLTQAIPLPMPFSMFIEVTNVCNFKCTVCPQSFPDFGERSGYYKRMSAEVWTKVVSDLQRWPTPLKVLRFWGTGEPLLHPGLNDIIIESQVLANRLELTTNGSLLTYDWQKKLIYSGLHYLCVSVYGTTEAQYQEATGDRAGLGFILRRMAAFREARDKSGRETPWITARLTVANPDRDAFEQQWSSIADDLVIEPLHSWGQDFVQLGTNLKTSKTVCPKPFTELVVHANGDVVACCADWDGHLLCGNILAESLQDIWTGQKLKHIQELHLAGQRYELVACKDCTLIYKQPDDLDSLLK